MSSVPHLSLLRRTGFWWTPLVLAVVGSTTFAVIVGRLSGVVSMLVWIGLFALATLKVVDASSAVFRVGAAIELCVACVIGRWFGGLYLLPAALAFLVLALMTGEPARRRT